MYLPIWAGLLGSQSLRAYYLSLLQARPFWGTPKQSPAVTREYVRHVLTHDEVCLL